jgi:glycosyltransferase involved in cell wall biosynthesis
MASQDPSAPLGIVFVSSHARNGGAERYLEALFDVLGPDWIRVVVCLEEGPFADRLRRSRPTKVIPMSGRWTSVLGGARRLRRLLRETRPDLVHANGIKAAIASLIAATGTGTPVVWVRHDFSFDGRLAHLVARRCRLTIAVSEAVARGLTRARVVHTATPVLGETKTVELDLPEGARIVALVGYFHPLKGQLELVEAAPAILARVPGAHFLFVGGEDPNAAGYLERVRARTRELGLEGSVSFLGHRPDAIDLLRRSEVSVAVTLGRGEGFGLAALESLAVGTPVVGYASGALPEIVADCGRLVRTGDRAELASAIVEVLDDPGLREKLSTCGRVRARDRFSLESWSRGMIEAYREAA